MDAAERLRRPRWFPGVPFKGVIGVRVTKGLGFGVEDSGFGVHVSVLVAYVQTLHAQLPFHFRFVVSI